MLTSHQRKLVRKGVKITNQIVELLEERAKIEKALAPVARKLKAKKRNTVDLSVRLPSGEMIGVTAEWKRVYKVDTKLALKLKKRLGDLWYKFFSEKITVNRARSFPKQREAAAIDPNMEEMLPKIDDAIDVVISKTPKFRW